MLFTAYFQNVWPRSAFLWILSFALLLSPAVSGQVNWTQVNINAGAFDDITFGDGIFVAVGSDQAVWTSPNATQWTSRNSNNAAQFNEVAISPDDSFIAVATQGGLRRSTNGTTWTLPSISPSSLTGTVSSTSFTGVAFGENRVVCVSEGFSLTSIIASTNDGATFSQATFATGTVASESFLDIVYGDGDFVAVGGSIGNGAIYRSATGNTSWTDVTPSSIGRVNRVIFGDTEYIAATESGQIYRSTNSTSWQEEFSGSLPFRAIAYSPALDLYVAAGGTPGGTGTGVIVISTNGGLSWSTPVTVPTISRINDVIFAANFFVAVDELGRIITSTNGQTWTQRRANDGGAFRSVIFANDTFVTVGQAGSSGRIFTSPSAIPDPPTNLTGMAVPDSNTEIDLNWTDNSSSEEGFIIERRLTGGGNFSQAGTVDENVTSFRDDGLSGGTSYDYRVLADGGPVNSSPSNIVTVATTNFTEIQFWRLDNFGSPANSGDGANENDSEPDTLENGTEFTFRTDPNAFTPPIFSTPTVNGTTLTFEIDFPALGSRAPVRIDQSMDLMTFTPVPGSSLSGGVNPFPAGTAGTQTVTVDVSGMEELFLQVVSIVPDT